MRDKDFLHFTARKVIMYYVGIAHIGGSNCTDTWLIRRE